MNMHYLPGRVCSTEAIRAIAAKADDKYTLISLKPEIRWIYRAEERMLQIAEATGAKMVYADRFTQQGEAPVIDYQAGALRDDFEFGAVTLWETAALRQAVAEMDTDYQFAGFYDLRLRVSRMGAIEHIPEYLYYEVEEDTRKSGEKLFDYVNPANRQVQIEMEQACTAHLKKIGAYISADSIGKNPLPLAAELRFGEGVPTGGEGAPVTASVIIPCKNRARTIGDAIRSALSQTVRPGYSYNVIVVDDNSTDGTVDIIRGILAELASGELKSQGELVYIPQDKSYHAIGGNWNVAFHSPRCGRYAIQLDSDDTYYDENTIQRFIDKFEEANYGMVIGTYRMTDIDGNILPPGVIDHREWTDDNGMNNALRINGLGAPRAFDVALLRTIDFPTTKYGEDYAVGLRICREYRIGRIYDVVYNCRRWSDNSDANCDIPAMNRNNWYKDRIRTWELTARLRLNGRQ